MSHFSCRPQCSCTVEQKRAREGQGNRGETRALFGEGGEYSYLLVLPDKFLLKSVVIKNNFKRNSSDKTRIYEYTPPPPPPINVLVSPLLGNDILTPAKPP